MQFLMAEWLDVWPQVSELVRAQGSHISRLALVCPPITGDGLVIETRMPFAREVGVDRRSYMNRKGYYGIVVQAFCDARGKFLYCSACHSGGTHDASAYAGSALCAALEQGLLPDHLYVIGDEAYRAAKQFLVPWSGRGLDPYRDSFNYHLSLMRQVIERSFGMVFKRWGLFQRPLLVGMDKWALTIGVAFKLHNYCVDRNVPMPQLAEEEIGLTDAAVAVNVAAAAQHEHRICPGRRSDLDDCPKRIQLTLALEEMGYLRPGFAYRRS